MGALALAVFWLAGADELAVRAPVPFLLSLSQPEPGKLHADIMNISEKERTYLHDPLRQPSELVVIDAQGDTVAALDTRAMTPSDTTVYKKLFSRLRPKERRAFGDGTIQGNAREGFELAWGPYRLSYVRPGRYKVSVVFKSRLTDCYDCTAAERARIARLWTGAVRSNELVIELR